MSEESTANDPVLIPPGGGEVVADAPDRRVEILSDHETLHATWSRFGPGRDGADLHVHRRHTDIFYVLDGELTLRLGVEDEAVAVPAGVLVRVPPLVVHGFRNGSEADVRYLNLHAPGRGFADFMRARRDGRPFSYDQHPPPPEGGRPPTEASVGRGELVADEPGLRVALLADVEEIAVAEVWRDPGAPSPPPPGGRHVQSLYVLEGALSVRAGGRELRAEAGSWAQLRPGVPHTASVEGDGRVRYVAVHTPGGAYGAVLRGSSPAPQRRT